MRSSSKIADQLSSTVLFIAATTDPAGCSNHSVGYKVQIKPHPLEHVLEDLDDLQSQDVLPDIVSHFEDAGLPDTALLQLGGVGFQEVLGGEEENEYKGARE